MTTGRLALRSLAVVTACGGLLGSAGAWTDPPAPADELASAALQPAELAKLLQAPQGKKPLLLQVGFHVLYVQAHIPGSEYLGPTSEPDGLAKLRDRVTALPRREAIVLYCGCCPWVRCPNLKPAYAELKRLGFTNVKVLHIDQNFGADWVDKGYPTAKGE